MAEILVIEDDDDLREISIKMLKLAGYDVIGTNTRDEAIKIIINQPKISTLLLDISMPGLSLEDFFRQLKDHVKRLYVIFSSGEDNEVVENFLAQNESYRFLAKPYGFSELQEVLQSI